MSPLNKVKYGVVILLVLAALVEAGIYWHNRCTKPSDMEVKLAAISCIRDLVSAPTALQAHVCEAIGKPADCDPDSNPEDAAKAREYLVNEIKSCTARKLKSAGMCTDKVSRL